MTTNRKMMITASVAIATMLFPAFAMADRRPAPRHAPPRVERHDSDRHFWPRFGLAVAATILQPRPAGHYVTVYEQVLVAPAHYETQYQQVLVAAARYETRYTPATYETVYDSMGNRHTVTVPARSEQVLVPAQYETRAVQVYVPAVYETRPVTQWVGY
ncbi:MAG: hypothetical protein ABFD92_09530 [Planctomycetaceae bacterium]|nr:hypothetical protein [Planctomycetaceae bacterium]